MPLPEYLGFANSGHGQVHLNVVVAPYGTQTLSFRFLNWLARAAADARIRAEGAQQEGRVARATQLRFRAAKLEDQHNQLINTIRLQHVACTLSRLRQKRDSDPEEVARLEADMKSLKSSRRSAPPRLLLRGHRVTLQIPFLSPDRKALLQVLGEKDYTALAGVDRGVRVPVALSVQDNGDYVDELLRVEHLLEKRERLREQASFLRSEVDRRRNNWDKKRPGLSHPAFLLKKDIRMLCGRRFVVSTVKSPGWSLHVLSGFARNTV